jgi:hypothetical protein
MKCKTEKIFIFKLTKKAIIYCKKDEAFLKNQDKYLNNKEVFLT